MPWRAGPESPQLLVPHGRIDLKPSQARKDGQTLLTHHTEGTEPAKKLTAKDSWEQQNRTEDLNRTLHGIRIQHQTSKQIMKGNTTQTQATALVSQSWSHQTAS